jgi:hypothetical protein
MLQRIRPLRGPLEEPILGIDEEEEGDQHNIDPSSDTTPKSKRRKKNYDG